jgi:hypothetical protein
MEVLVTRFARNVIRSEAKKAAEASSSAPPLTSMFITVSFLVSEFLNFIIDSRCPQARLF